VQQTPDAVAVSAVDGELTYAQLDEQSDQLAAYLRPFVTRPDTLIGLALPRSRRLLVAILGILKAGAAYLPLDPSYPPQRIQYMLEHAQAPLLITDSTVVDSLPEHEAQTLLLDSQWPQVEQAGQGAVDYSQLDDLAYVIYTSG